MYTAMADVAALMGDQEYVKAIDTIWNDVVSKKLYITGGTGSKHKGEAYGWSYHLPNSHAYCESCAAIANVYWNHRMFLMRGDAKYIDVMERSLYNNVLAAVSFDGTRFFYPNVLACDKRGKKRDPWFGVACCPSNISRFLASFGGYMYAIRDDAIYVNLYGQSEATIKLGSRTVKLVQTTDYPWQGKVNITVTPDKAGSFTLKLRLPGWAKNQPVPSDLYRVAPGSKAKWEFSCSVNGKGLNPTFEKGYAVITRKWTAGDTVETTWPLVVQRILSHEKVQENRDRVALQRGPIVYCVEHPDVPGGNVVKLVLPDKALLKTEHRKDFLQGVTVITGTATGDAGKNVPFTAIPYYAWCHRGKGEMAVWLKRSK
jgi:DUF1680 family protein